MANTDFTYKFFDKNSLLILLGESGSGKSNLEHILIQHFVKHRKTRIFLYDCKQVEFACYAGGFENIIVKTTVDIFAFKHLVKQIEELDKEFTALVIIDEFSDIMYALPYTFEKFIYNVANKKFDANVSVVASTSLLNHRVLSDGICKELKTFISFRHSFDEDPSTNQIFSRIKVNKLQTGQGYYVNGRDIKEIATEKAEELPCCGEILSPESRHKVEVGKYNYSRPDFTKWPMILNRDFSLRLSGDSKDRYVQIMPKFVDIYPEFALEHNWFESPAEFCLISSMEYARRKTKNRKYTQMKNGFTDSEIAKISKGDKRIIFEYFDHPEAVSYYGSSDIAKRGRRIFNRNKKPDFTKEKMYLRKTYEYRYEYDDSSKKSRGECIIPQFTNISSEWAQNNGWVDDDSEFSIIADLEYSRRNPYSKFAKGNTYYNLFSVKEVVDICRGSKKLIF